MCSSFRNRPCELPIVWISPSRANEVCQLQGKRLCTQDEWVLACRGNPDGPDVQNYAYGSDLDLTACHTRGERSAGCDPTSVKSTRATCASDTAPVGSFPRCRSRLGVFDQHGNVAEIMQRWDADRGGRSRSSRGARFSTRRSRCGQRIRPTSRSTPIIARTILRWHVENSIRRAHDVPPGIPVLQGRDSRARASCSMLSARWRPALPAFSPGSRGRG